MALIVKATKSGKVAVLGAGVQHRITERALGGFAVCKTVKDETGAAVKAWIVPAKFVDTMSTIVERINSQLAIEEKVAAAVAAKRPAANALAPSRFRNMLGQCGHCDDGRCCGRCNCC